MTFRGVGFGRRPGPHVGGASRKRRQAARERRLLQTERESGARRDMGDRRRFRKRRVAERMIEVKVGIDDVFGPEQGARLVERVPPGASRPHNVVLNSIRLRRILRRWAAACDRQGRPGRYWRSVTRGSGSCQVASVKRVVISCNACIRRSVSAMTSAQALSSFAMASVSPSASL